MEYLIIGVAYIFVVYLFYNISKVKKDNNKKYEKNKKNYNKIYFSIIMIFICFAIWAVIRMIK